MINFKNSSITFLLPQYLADKREVKALAFAVNKQIAKMLEYSKNIMLYANIDRLDGFVLDLLALELNTPFYRNDLVIDVKRELIKNSLQWARIVGTTGAVEDVVRTVFGEGEVKEWDEYGGEPSHFKVITSAPLDEANIDYFNRVIKNVKNKRSKLDLVEVHRRENLISFACAVLNGYSIAPDIVEGG